ncbi:MAG: undecaprenyl-diphosphate phosphatase [Epsilonproteobacteria bacterium]|nr:undecaprenyl-diphosphate phosphatase [Campylobacterota bacterium]
MNDVCVVMLVQMITEMLPISSSGHVMLVLHMFARLHQQAVVLPELLDDCAHVSALFVYVIFFLWLYAALIKRVIFFMLTRASCARLARIIVHAALVVGIADGVTVVCYGVRSVLKKNVPLYTSVCAHPLSLALGFALTMLVLFSLRWQKNEARTTRMTYSGALQLGLVQSVSLLWPGLSRFAFVYTFLRAYGLRRDRAFTCTFLVFLPLVTAVAARGVHGGAFAAMHAVGMSNMLFVLTTCLAAGIFFVVWQMVQTKRLWYCAWYMLVPLLSTCVLLMF